MVKGDNEPENLKLRFLVEGTEIDVPEHFHLFSVVVENYIKTYLVDDNGTPKDGGDTVIPLSNFKMDHLQVIYDFFYALRDHPPREKSAVKDSDDTYAQQSGSAHAVENDGDESVNGAVVDEESINNNDAPDAGSSTSVPKKNMDFSHLSSDIKVSNLPDWSNEFFDKVPKERLFQASLLANFLLAHPFIEHAAFYIANKLKSMKTIQEMRDYLNAKNDFKSDEFDLLKNDPDWRERLLKEGLIEDDGQTA